MKYKKKPVVINACQFRGDNGRELLEFAQSYATKDKRIDLTVYHQEKFVIRTLEGEMTGEVGDWLIIGINNEPYPCKHDIFLKTYERVE